MPEQRNPVEIAQVIQQNYARMTEDELRGYIADDCVIYEAPSLPFGGAWTGPSGFVALMRKMQECFLELEFVPVSLFTDNQDHLAFQGRLQGRTAKGTFDMPLVEYWTFKDGKLKEVHAMWQDSKQICDLM